MKKYNFSKPNKRLLFLSILLFGSLYLMQAQINTNKFRVDVSSLNFKACSDANNGLTTVTIQSKQATATNFVMAFDLPDGVYYQAGLTSITSQAGSSDFILSEVDVSDLNRPVFKIERPNNAPWQINDEVVFTYQKTADCEAVQYSYSGGLFKDNHSITFTDDEGPQSAEDMDPSIGSYNLFRPFLSVSDIQNITEDMGVLRTRDITIRNSGNGSLERFEHEVIVSEQLQANYELHYNGTVLTPVISGNQYLYAIDLNLAPFAGQVGNGDNFFDNENITLVESLSISECGVDQVTIHSSKWGCIPDVYCQITTAKQGVFTAFQKWPDLQVTNINKPLPRWNAPVTYSYRVRNEATTENAYNVQINIGYTDDSQTSASGVNPLYGDDSSTNRKISNFRFRSGGSITLQRWDNTVDPLGGAGSYYLPEDFFTFNPDGPGGLEDLDGDGFFDDLGPGERLVIRFDLTMLPRLEACSPDEQTYSKNLALRADFWSENSCDFPTPTHREDVNEHNVGKESLFEWINPEDYDRDIGAGGVFKLNFVGNLRVLGDAPTCRGIEMLSNDPSTMYTATINVPEGFYLHSSADARFSQTGNQITFVETNLADYIVEDFPMQIPVDFLLEIDCDEYVGPVELDIYYSTSYGSTCFNTDLHCGVFNLITHCGDACVSGPRIVAFDVNRATSGWTDETMTTRVTLDPDVHATKYYMAKDEMVINATARMLDDVSDNLYFEINYVTADNGVDMSNIIDFDFGNITINDLSSTTESTQFTIKPEIITTNGNDHKMTFDLSSYRDIISPTYQYGEGIEADEIELELHFKIAENFPEEAQLFQFFTFRGNFHNFSTSGAKKNCIYRTDRAFFFKNKLEYVPTTSISSSGCDETWLTAIFEQTSNLDDKFPNEFRPPVLWQSTSFELPPGMVFNNSADSEEYTLLQPEDETPNSTNGGLEYTVVGNTVTVTPGSRFIHFDQNLTYLPIIKIPVIATSALPAISNYNVSVSYLEYPYSDNAILVTDTGSTEFNYANADFSILNTAPITIGSSELAGFTVDISNNTADQIDYNWLRVETGSGYTITNAFLVEGATETLLNIVGEGTNYFIEVGAIESAPNNIKQIRFEGNYNDCNLQTIKVSQNYDCLAYPTTYTGLPYFNEQEYTLQPVTAAIQLEIISQPTTTVETCTDYEVELELRNAGEADLILPTITFDIPGDPNAIIISEISIEYPKNSGNREVIAATIDGNTVTIDLAAHSIIELEKGISGSLKTTNLNEQIAQISLVLNPQCSYRSNVGTTYTAEGNSPCGGPAIGSGSRLANNPIIITGAEPPYSTSNVAISSPNLIGCATETVSVETFVVDGTTGFNDFTRLIMPAGLIYVPESLTSTGTADVTYVSTSIVGGSQVIEIALPSGADNTDKIAYTFGVESTADICEGNYDIELSTYVTKTGLTCGGVACGTTEIVTGQVNTEIAIVKARLDQSSLVATASFVQGSQASNYKVSFGIENTGNVDLESGITYNIFCSDVNGLKTGNAIYANTIDQPIAVGSSIEKNISFNSDVFCGLDSDIIVEFSPGTSNCFCEPLTINIESVASSFGGIISFEIDNIIVNETDGTATLSVIYVGIPLSPFTVDYITVDNTAIVDQDYSFVSGTLSFSGTDGQVQTITIPIIDDDLIETLELLNVQLSNLSSDLVDVGIDLGTVTIIDDEIDSDGDKIPDSLDIDDDNDGILDTTEGDGNVDTDGDGYPDSIDIDSDNDGIPDNVEAQDTVTYIAPTGTDTDADGLDDAYDGSENLGITPINTDNDNLADFRDLDADNDSVPDNNEGNDFNFDGVPDYIFTGVDTDGDGLDDGYEGSDVNDGFDVNDEIDNPANDLPDTDGTDDVNYRDLNDDGDNRDTVEEDDNGDGDPTNDDEDSDGRPDYLDLIDDRFNIPTIEDFTIICGEAVPPMPDLSDIAKCGTIEIIFSEEIISIEETTDYIIYRIWQVSDTCGNSTLLEQQILVLQPTLAEITINICVEEAAINLEDYLPENFDNAGTFTLISGDATLENNVLDPSITEPGEYVFAYESTESTCKFYAELTIVVNTDCVLCSVDDIITSKTITINGDNVNAFMTITAPQFCNYVYDIMIFNRWGNKVYEATDYKNNWGGVAPANSMGKSGTLPTGTYYYILDAIGKETHQIKGYIYIGAE